jgi:hypothetical protein
MRAHAKLQRGRQRVCLRCAATAKRPALLLDRLCAANRPAGTREALPGSIIVPPSIEINFNLAETMLWSKAALHLSFETTCSLFAEAEDASRVYDETLTAKFSSVRHHLAQSPHIGLAH